MRCSKKCEPACLGLYEGVAKQACLVSGRIVTAQWFQSEDHFGQSCPLLHPYIHPSTAIFRQIGLQRAALACRTCCMPASTCTPATACYGLGLLLSDYSANTKPTMLSDIPSFKHSNVTVNLCKHSDVYYAMVLDDQMYLLLSGEEG